MLKENAHETHKKLSEQMDKPTRKHLLHLVDEMDALSYHACLVSFVCGYKLAHGIHQELLPSYNFEEDDALRAYAMLRGEG